MMGGWCRNRWGWGWFFDFMNDVMFSSASDDWATPATFFEDLDRIYSFTLDVCASESNAKCARFFDKKKNGLLQSWAGETCWMNPPYGREIGAWIKKAYEESQQGAYVVALVPARTDTAWWHEWAMKGQVTFIRGRLKFGGSKNSAPFPSALVEFKAEVNA